MNVNYFVQLPNELFQEIAQHLSFTEMIHFNLINRKYRILTKQIVWKRIVKEFAYVIVGYQFTDGDFDIESHAWYDVDYVEYKYAIARLSTYNSIKLTNTPVTASLLNTLRSVKKINLFNCRICDGSLQYFNNATDLRLSYYGSDEISDNGLKQLSNIKHLELINYYEITGDGIKDLVNITELKLINCSSFDETFLQYLVNLSSLSLCDCSQITDAGMRYLSNVIELDLNGCSKITDCGLASLSSVRKLNLTRCKLITDEGLGYLANVTELILYECELITDCGIHYLKSIHKLKLSSNTNITDDSLCELTSIQNLSLNAMNSITDNAFTNLTNLRSLKLIKCNNLTDKMFANLRSIRCLTLRVVPKITDKIFEYIPNVVYLNLISVKITGTGFTNLRQIDKLYVDNLLWCNFYSDIDAENLRNVPIRKLKFPEWSPLAKVDFSTFKNIATVKIWDNR